MKRILFLSAFLIAIGSPFAKAEVLTCGQAAQHIGEVQTVRGVVVSTIFSVKTKGQPTYLNFDKPSPDTVFSVLIPPADRSKFASPPEEMFNGKTVRVTGKITTYAGKPQIVVNDPAQIDVE